MNKKRIGKAFLACGILCLIAAFVSCGSMLDPLSKTFFTEDSTVAQGTVAKTGFIKDDGMIMGKTAEVCIVSPGIKAHIDVRNNYSWSSYLKNYKKEDFKDYYDIEYRRLDNVGIRTASFYDDLMGVFYKNRFVTLSPFILGRYEVTQELYETVMKSDPSVNPNPSCFANADKSSLPDEEELKYRPVENVSYFDAIYFCNALTKKAMSEEDCVYKITNIVRDPKTKGITFAKVESDIKKKGYRLPTEAEWEFAARGGDPQSDVWKYAFSGAQLSKGNILVDMKKADDRILAQDNNLDKLAWYQNNSASKTHQVGKKKKNTLGLYDMSGNVSEWSYDASVVLKPETVVDPHYEASPDEEWPTGIIKGGNWSTYVPWCTVSARCVEAMPYPSPYTGFRICRSASLETPANWDTKAPGQVSSLKADAKANSIALSWSNPTNTDLSKVRVFWTKSTDENTILGTIFVDAVPQKKMSLEVTDLKIGEKYKFFVQTIDKSGNYPKAKTVQAVCIQSYGNISLGKTQVPKTESVLITSSVASFTAPKERSIDVEYSTYFRDNVHFYIEPFIMGKYEVTWDLFEKVMPSDSFTKTVNVLAKYFDSLDKKTVSDYTPVDSITWYDAVFFCNELTKKTMSEKDCVYSITDIVRDNTSRQIVKANVSQNLDKKGYRLPTEAEWEFAARGGALDRDDWNYEFSGIKAQPSKLYGLAKDENLDRVAWYGRTVVDENGQSCSSSFRPKIVGLKKPNSLNLYDMSGNVREWCWDRFVPNSIEYDTSTSSNNNAESRVIRGGSFEDDAFKCFVFYRSGAPVKKAYRNIGFRVVRRP